MLSIEEILAMVSELEIINGILLPTTPTEVTTNITSQVLDGISSHSSLLDAYVILHGTLIASLHKLIGIDFGA